MKIELNCADCGENHFALGAELTDACTVLCQECGHEVGTWGDVKESFARLVMGQSYTH